MLNVERQKEQVDKLSYEVFEIIMDRLEKEWFDLVCLTLAYTYVAHAHLPLPQMKRIPTPASALPVEDSRCAICDDSEGENANAIVFCDGCNLAVHQGGRGRFLVGAADERLKTLAQTAMGSRISRKVNGCAASAPCRPRTQWCVSALNDFISSNCH